MIDWIDTAASMDENLPVAQAAALRFVKTLRQQDRTRQVHFPSSLSERDTVYERIAEELRTQYTLGYVSSHKRGEGKWRRIVVRVPERGDVRIRHELGYLRPAWLAPFQRVAPIAIRCASARLATES